jgi:hypothetical protein
MPLHVDSGVPQVCGHTEPENAPNDSGAELNSGVPQVGVPPIGKRAGHTGGGVCDAPLRAAVPQGSEAHRGTPGHTGAHRPLCRPCRWRSMVDSLLRASTTAEVPQPAPAADGGDGADTPKGTGNESTSAGNAGPGLSLFNHVH